MTGFRKLVEWSCYRRSSHHLMLAIFARFTRSGAPFEMVELCRSQVAVYMTVLFEVYTQY